MKPYWSDESIALYHGDWRDHLREITALEADLIVTDPPYGETRLKWDVWPDLWPAMAIHLAPMMWCFGSMRMFLDHHHEFHGWRISQDLVWEKHNGSNLHSDRFSRVHEHAVLWYQGRWADRYHVTPTTPDAVRRTVRKKARPAQWVGEVGASTYRSEDGGPRLMRSVIYARSMHGRAINEAEKPSALLEPLITYGCPPGGLVLDLFAGSCSTAVAARATGRRAVCFEERESQCEAAARRLDQGVFTFAEGC